MGNVAVVHSLNFSYPAIPIRYFPDFLFTANSSIAVDALQVTYDSSNANMSNLSGRVCYAEKLKLWRKINKSVASFNTTFELNIMGKPDPGGEGMAFILTADDAVPFNSEGQWLGIVNATTNGTKEAEIVAVEFDTKKSYMEDADSNHLGLNINSIKSISQVPLRSYGVELLSGTNVKVIVEYDGNLKRMNIFVSMSNGTEVNTTNPTLSVDIDLTKHLPEDVYVGFSASTGSQVELNCVKSWSFNSTNVESGISIQKQLLWLRIMIPTLVIVLLCGLAGYLVWKREENKKKRRDPYIIHRLESSTASPCSFRLKELKSATRNFDPIKSLGKEALGQCTRDF
ncbi:hypothetical protein MKW98_018842 [Papaver atlanticum]|uniref:Legume lectin domain-containing protein n=1 Tax=Papaver atlanticum TaxID=357466 RepID=A0AAD4TL58_9MAGN|nr:hypothetical protein MKW98_018842 [Papaver atlanticum]